MWLKLAAFNYKSAPPDEREELYHLCPLFPKPSLVSPVYPASIPSPTSPTLPAIIHIAHLSGCYTSFVPRREAIN